MFDYITLLDYAVFMILVLGVLIYNKEKKNHLLKRIRKYEQTLMFYASEKTYNVNTIKHEDYLFSHADIDEDMGTLARATLHEEYEKKTRLDEFIDN